MKVVNITPGILPIPPNGWGAVEKIIWDYHMELLKNNVASEIKYLDDIKYDDNMVVHVHVANLANECFRRGIPYIFTIHDHHAFFYGKESKCFRDNLEAIENSIISLSPCKYFLKYFGSKKLRYFSHAVNTETFLNKKKPDRSGLLCVANNGYIDNKNSDRKGFKIAIEAAISLNMPITIAGPDNNKSFFSNLSDDLNSYSGLNKIFNLNEEQLIELYNKHKIFLHFSELEAGHPNLTLLEAMSCGLPVIGTFEEKNYDGMLVTERNVDSAVQALKNVTQNFDFWYDKACENACKNSYSNRVFDLLEVYTEYREKIFGNRLLDLYKKTKKMQRQNRILTSFIDGPKVEILGQDKKKYIVNFIDKDKNEIIYGTEINNNMWSCCSKKYFINWKIEVYEKNGDYKDLIFSEDFDLKEKRVLVVIDSKSLGDTVAYIGQIDKFQRKHGCNVDALVPNEEMLEILKASYKNINFVKNDWDAKSYYAIYKICYALENWENSNPLNPKEIPLQMVASSVLGLDFEEIKPKLKLPDIKTNGRKYICIATQSTAQCKYWNNESGWERLIKYLNSIGYDVWCIDRHASFGNKKHKMNFIPKGAIDKTGDYSLDTRMSQIYNSEFFIGLGSGLSWLAWALDKPVVLISGFSKPFAEFETPYRIINESVCNGCWNDPNLKFDKADWMWCPRGRNFECSSKITPEMVIEKINTLL
jgi:autotransporter strand-loop-strand O-heptosyltransferase